MDPRIIAAVQAATNDPRYQATMYYACGAESGCEPVAQIGGGPGRGPWQMETTWEPEARAMNPFTAALDFFARWPVKKCADAQGDLWNSAPTQAAFNAARCAESNQSGQGAAYNAAQMKAGEDAMAVGLGSTGVGTGTSGPAPISAFCSLPFIGNVCIGGGIVNKVTGGIAGNAATSAAKAVLQPLFDLFGNHAFWIRAILVVSGVGMLFIGLSGLTHVAPVPVPIPV